MTGHSPQKRGTRNRDLHWPIRRPHLIIPVGISGAGKTTYGLRLQARCPALRIASPDLVRERLYPGYADGRVDVRKMDDRKVFRAAYREVERQLSAGHDVFFDATNLTISRRSKLIAIGWQHHAVIIARFFVVNLDEALRRNRTRARQVPAGAIVRMLQALQPPEEHEGFDRMVEY